MVSNSRVILAVLQDLAAAGGPATRDIAVRSILKHDARATTTKIAEVLGICIPTAAKWRERATGIPRRRYQPRQVAAAMPVPTTLAQEIPQPQQHELDLIQRNLRAEDLDLVEQIHWLMAEGRKGDATALIANKTAAGSWERRRAVLAMSN